MTKPITSVNRNNGSHSEFWRELSWRCGDTHANRICWLVDMYCKLTSLDRSKFYTKLPQSERCIRSETQCKELQQLLDEERNAGANMARMLNNEIERLKQ